MRHIIVVGILVALVGPLPAALAQPPAAGGAVFVAYYWRAKPGQLDAYNEYIRTVAVPIDDDARKAGVFEEVRTVMPGSGIAADWTHLRIFRLKEGLKEGLKDAAAVQALSAGLDAATARIVPDEAQRKANSARAAGLRDFVRQEIWIELR